MDFNPYKQWLQIDDRECPHHYELLGLPIFSDDGLAIQQAYAERFARVRRYEVGNYSEHAIRVIGELSAAFHCLTDDQKKREYDLALREDLAARETRLDLPRADDGDGTDSFQTVIDEALRSQPPRHDGWASGVPRLAYSEPVAPPIAEPTKEKVSRHWFAVAAVAFVPLVTTATWFALDGNGENLPDMPPVAMAALPEVDASSEDEAAEDSADVAWHGKLIKMLVTRHDTELEAIRLRISDGQRTFEAVSTDEEIIARLQEGICAAEHATNANQVTVRGVLHHRSTSFFTPGETIDLVDVKDIEIPTTEVLSHEQQRVRRALRTVGEYRRFRAEVAQPASANDNRLLVAINKLYYHVELPPAWQELYSDLSTDDHITVVAEATNEYLPVRNASEVTTALVLRAETVEQPDFADVERAVADFADQQLIYCASVQSTRVQDDTAIVRLTLRHAGRSYAVHASAPITLDTRAWLEGLDWRESMLAELQIKSDGDTTEYQLASLTNLRTPSKRAVFDHPPAVNPEAKPTVSPPVEDTSPLAVSIADPALLGVLEGLPAAVDLPSPADSTHALLTFKSDPGPDIEIELDSSLVDLAVNRRFVVQRAEEEESRWNVLLQNAGSAGIQEVEVGLLKLEASELRFAWTDTASPASQLKNCFITLIAGTESHAFALRTPQARGPAALPKERDDFRIPFSLGDLPRTSALRIDVAVSYNGEVAESPTGSTVPMGRTLTFPIPNGERAQIEVQLRKLSGRPLMLEAVPQFKSLRRTVELTHREMATEQLKLQQSIRKARENYLRAVRDNNRRSMRTIQGTIDEVEDAAASLITLREALAGFIWAGTRIRYRLYALAATGELVLVDGGYDFAEANLRDGDYSDIPLPAVGASDAEVLSPSPASPSPRRRRE